MATPNPDSTKQITVEVIKRWYLVKDSKDDNTRIMDDQPSNPSPPLAGRSNQRFADCNGLPSTTHNEPSSLSPLASPSAITPTSETGELQWNLESSPSPNDEEPLKIHRDHRQATELAREFMQDCWGPDTNLSTRDKQTVSVVVDRLKIISDEFDQQLSSTMLRTIIRAFLSGDGSVTQQFMYTISSLRKELSPHLVFKVFYFGYQLFTSIHSLDFYGEQQRLILSVFTDFLVNEISAWIDLHGGWTNILVESCSQRLHSYSTSDLDDTTTPTNEVPIEVSESHPAMTPPSSKPPRSQSLCYGERRPPISRSIPCKGTKSRPTTLPLNMAHSYPRRQHSRESSTPTTPTGSPCSSTSSRGSLTNIVSFGVGMSLGFALCTFFFSSK